MIQTLEELSLNAWPSLQTSLYDGWILRFAAGYTKRSNSISPLYPSTLPLLEKLDNCETAYHQRNLAAIFKLTPESNPGEIDRELERRQYVRLDETSVRLLQLRDYQQRIPVAVMTENHFTPEWLQDFCRCSNLDPAQRHNAQMLLNNITNDIIVIRKQVDGETVGCGFGVIERGFVGIYDIVVAPKYRGLGYGRDIMDGILGAALQKGVNTAYLSVVAGNEPAENLYQKLGFREMYHYWYRKQEF